MSLCFLVILTLVSCGNKQQKKQLSIIQDSLIQKEKLLDSLIFENLIQQNDSADKKHTIFTEFRPIHLKYKTPVNGYDIDVLWTNITPISLVFWAAGENDKLIGTAIIRFKKENCYTEVIHESFTLDMSVFDVKTPEDFYNMKDFYVIEYDKGKSSTYDKFPSRTDLPFFFCDVNFDGKKDLILNLYCWGARFSNAYRVYLAENDCFETDLLYRATEQKPYIKFDDNTEFDYKKKEITLYSSGGWATYTKEFYKLNKYGDFELYKIEELEHPTLSEYEMQKVKISEKVLDETE